MRVLNLIPDLILELPDLIPRVSDFHPGGPRPHPEFSDLILRSIAKAMRLEG
jgi:hypothetical protein